MSAAGRNRMSRDVSLEPASQISGNMQLAGQENCGAQRVGSDGPSLVKDDQGGNYYRQVNPAQEGSF